MIKVFLATDTDYTTNGEVILQPNSAVIVKTTEEEYLELDAPLKYADFLIQENILILDTLTGKKGYRINNPVLNSSITVKAWLFYQEYASVPADRGVVIAHGKNLENPEVTETWDMVVTKLIPVGYNGAKLPEGYLSIASPYTKVYEKTIEFNLPEELEEVAKVLEEAVETNESLEATLKNSIPTLQAKYDAYGQTITSLQSDITRLQQRLSQLGNTEPELKEKAVIEAQLPLINSDIATMTLDRANVLSTLDTTKASYQAAVSDLATARSNYDALVINNLRTQAQAYLNINMYPQINYELEAHLEGVLEIGDTIKVKHPDMKIDLLTNVTAYELDCITFRYNRIEFGTAKLTLKGKLTQLEEKIEAANETIKNTANTIKKYTSEYKKSNEELVSKFTEEIYGAANGIYGLIQKNSSMLRQTASEISGTVSRVNADLSTQVASLKITADQISASVAANYTTLDGKITSNNSLITQTANEIRSEVSASVISLDGKISNNTSLITQTANQIRSEVSSKFVNYSTTTQMNSAISQSANSITSSVNTTINGVKTDLSQVEQTADKINWLVKSGYSASDFTLTDRAISLVANSISLTGYVTFASLSTAGSSNINGANISTGTLSADKITTGLLSANRISGGILNCSLMTVTNLSASAITTGILDASRITVTNLNASSITSGSIEVSYIRANGYKAMNVSGNVLTIGGTSSYYAITNVSLAPSSLILGASGGTLGFFGASGAYKRSIYSLSSSASLSTTISKINELITILKDYKLVA